MKLLDIFKKKQPKPAVRSRVPMPEPVAKKPANARLDDIIAYIKAHTAQQAYRLVTDTDGETDLFSSKLGGVPYWEAALPYPTDGDGNPFYLLLQLNLDRASIADERLPQGGMLQFFISPLDKCECKVIFHPTINYDAEADSECVAMPCDGMPVLRETAVHPEAFEDYLSISSYRFEAVLREAVRAVTGEDIGAAEATDYFNDADLQTVGNALSGSGSKLFGYPVFTQWDPREEGTNYPQLLLQVDSDLKERTVMWGDCGVGNFFIGNEALAARHYEDILYYWDCC